MDSIKLMCSEGSGLFTKANFCIPETDEDEEPYISIDAAKLVNWAISCSSVKKSTYLFWVDMFEFLSFDLIKYNRSNDDIETVALWLDDYARRIRQLKK